MKTSTNKDKILEISKNLGLSHIGSNLSVLPILEEIYSEKKPEDKVIMDNAHAHLAHLVVVRDWFLKHNIIFQPTDEEKIEKYGIHCERKAGCDASGGSLGHGIGIGIGYALANPDKTIYVIVSDGSMMEGSNWEALRIRQALNLNNLILYCNFNGYSAVAPVDIDLLKKRILSFYDKDPFNLYFVDSSNTEGFEGVQGHYRVLEK